MIPMLYFSNYKYQRFFSLLRNEKQKTYLVYIIVGLLVQNIWQILSMKLAYKELPHRYTYLLLLAFCFSSLLYPL